MISQGPFTLTIGAPLSLPDPGATSNNPSAGVQLQNASPVIIQVLAGGDIYTIQSFTAQTIPTGSGIPLTVTPIISNQGGLTSYPNTLTVVWLLAHESPPMQDGPLTAAAVAFGLANTGIAGSSGLTSAAVTVPMSSLEQLTGPPASPIQIWSWGYYAAVGGTNPTMGFVLGLFGGATGSGVTDTLSYVEAGSSRLSGLRAEGNEIEFVNETNAAVTCYINYSPA